MPPDHGVETPIQRVGHAAYIPEGNRVGMSPLDAPHHFPRDPGDLSKVFLTPAVACPHRPERNPQLSVIHDSSLGRVDYHGLTRHARVDPGVHVGDLDIERPFVMMLARRRE